ncbi:HWE histidine kinase domain-containing protein [Shimia ponticola]|uniref:HWE histidine kinase domain-containing protein n=1 Tax=Shimia ponticola TaxID=2582893 RepID=UPI0011BF338C|nr:HWE histidine kinase domain-containing protein [Shimia ponticola]
MNTPQALLKPGEDVDLTSCDREPIHILGNVQDFGCLIAMSSDWIVAHASVNCGDVINRPASEMIGKPVSAVFEEETVHFLRSRLQVLSYQEGAARVFGFDLLGDGRLFDISLHQMGRFFIFEFEPVVAGGSSSTASEDAASVQALLARLKRHDQTDKMLNEAARSMRALTGMDRVMVYKFAEDGSGEVVAEALASGQEPYLGLRYPASDIPKQARALYEKSVLRIIGDIDAPVHAIHPEFGADGEPLDLSMAVTRAVSPIHLEYLRNMGVQASMSVSILRKGKLWGLFACHHRTPINISYQRRSAVELFVQLFNYELAQKETETELADLEKSRLVHDRLMSQISSGRTLHDVFETVADDIADIIAFDGIAIYSEGTYRSVGSAPTEEEFLGLARFLNTAETSSVVAMDELSARYPPAADYLDRAAGLLAIPISRRPRDYLVLFRREVARSVRWAGNPEKPVEVGPNGIRLTPRKSFDAWREVVHGKSAPWRKAEMKAADALRVTLLEVVLKLADETNATRQRAQEQQELLIAELNHRVRNILNLIQGLMNQGRGDAVTIDDYCRVLDDRIRSMARAHDQLTQTEWGWVPFERLVKTETEAFISSKNARVTFEGDAVALSPNGFTTMALVVHELMTNSAKYGALSDGSGGVQLSVRANADGSANIIWAESGGPAVQAPTRKGFGTTIIERSIPFELKGTAKVNYRMTGLEAEFWLPSTHVREVEEEELVVQTTAETEVANARTLKGEALAAEDNMIISMDVVDILEELGASRVHAAPSVRDALRILENETISFAVLDVNLGTETSIAIAEKCKELSIPFILATGYSGTGGVLDEFPKAKVIQKPYSLADVRAVLPEEACT